MQDAAPRCLQTQRLHGGLPVAQQLGRREVPYDGLRLLCHGRYRGVGHTQHKGLVETSWDSLLAERVNLRTGSVGDFEPLQQIRFAIEQCVERYPMQQAVGHDDEFAQRSRSVRSRVYGFVKERLERLYQLPV